MKWVEIPILRKRLTIFVPAIVAVIVTASGCSSSNAPEAGSGSASGRPDITGLKCVDTSGPNSTPDQIVGAALAAPASNLPGENRTVRDVLPLTFGLDPGETLRVDYESEQAAEVFNDVPLGGDASFAAAACELHWDVMNGSYLFAQRFWPTDDSTRNRVASTPHLLRGMGRWFCGQQKSADRADLQAEFDRELQEAQSDPEGYKASYTAEIERQIKAEQELAAGPLIFDAKATAAALDNLKKLPAEELAQREEAWYQIHKLAIQHLCPQFQ